VTLAKSLMQETKSENQSIGRRQLRRREAPWERSWRQSGESTNPPSPEIAAVAAQKPTTWGLITPGYPIRPFFVRAAQAPNKKQQANATENGANGK